MPFCFSDFLELYKRKNSKILQNRRFKRHNGLSKARNGSPAEGETRENKRGKSSLSLSILLSFSLCCFFFVFFLLLSLSPRLRISLASSLEFSLRFRNRCSEKSMLLLLLLFFQSLVMFSSSPAQPLSRPLTHSISALPVLPPHSISALS